MKLRARLLRWWRKFLGIHPVHKICIAQSVVDDIRYMASQAHPKEMLAFLAATKGNQQGVFVIDEIQLQAYNASEDHAMFQLYQLPPYSSIIGTVHSHPNGNASPSDADVRLFGQFGMVHGIIGSPYVASSLYFYAKNGDELRVDIDST